MASLAADTFGELSDAGSEVVPSSAEGTLRAHGGSKIETPPEILWEKELLEVLGSKAERAGFEPAVGPKPYADLANRCLQPLGHLSGGVSPGKTGALRLVLTGGK